MGDEHFSVSSPDYRTENEYPADRVARFGHVDMRAQAVVPSARRTDTPTYVIKLNSSRLGRKGSASATKG
jgi:hypothetical protein